MNRLALDMDAVLAETHRAFLRTYNMRNNTNYRLDDISYWDWPTDEFGLETFIQLTDEEWKERTSNIEPCESEIAEKVSTLSDTFDIDIVTARSGCKDSMSQWIEEHGITEYQSFFTGIDDKPSLGYDYYVDDNPNMVGKLNESQVLFLRERSWNRPVDSSNVFYVSSILEPLELA